MSAMQQDKTWDRRMHLVSTVNTDIYFTDSQSGEFPINQTIALGFWII